MPSGIFDIYSSHSQLPLFGQIHPALRAALALTVLLVTLGCFSIVLLAFSLLLALGLLSFLQSPAAAGRALRNVLPLLVVIVLLNPLISPSGTHRLFALGPFVIYGESLLWGILTGLMLSASLLWLDVFGHILPADELCDLLGSVAPVLALMISMVMRLVPDLFHRAQGAKAARDACTAAHPQRPSQAPTTSFAEKPTPQKPLRLRGFDERLSWAARLSSALLGWTLAGSLDRASSMEARGWGVGPRSHYYQWRWTLSQIVQLGLLVALDLLLLGAFILCGAGWTSVPSLETLLVGTLPWPLMLIACVALVLPLALSISLSWQERRLP